MLNETKKPYKSVGAFIENDNELELLVVLHINPFHKNYRKFIDLLKKIQMEQKGLIKASSGLP